MTDALLVQVLDGFEDLFEYNLSSLLSVVVNVANFLHQLHSAGHSHDLVDLAF